MLDNAVVPEKFAYLWKRYVEISTLGGVTWVAIEAWSRLRKIELEQWELDALFKTWAANVEINNA